MTYKNYIFDCGNVLFGFSRQFLLDKYVGEDKEKQKLLCDVMFSRWEEQDAGKPSLIFVDEIKKELPEDLKEAAENIILRWPIWIRPFEDISNVITELKRSGHKIYLLSNMPDIFANNHDQLPILNDFDDIIFSCHIGMIKPFEDIYKHAINKWGINPSESIFIDDNLANCETAKRVGLNAYKFDPNNRKDFVEYVNEKETIL